MNISINFNIFCDRLKVSEIKKSNISDRYHAIIKKLNNDFWNLNTSFGGVYSGCYGRETANDDIKEIDMIFEMPSQLKDKYEKCGKGCQIRFLKDVRRSITKVYKHAYLDKENLKIVIQFPDGMCFNILPAFVEEAGNYVFVDCGNKESWRNKKPLHLIEAINQADQATNYNLKKLCRMVKAWKQHCQVKIKDVLIDTLVYDFLLSSKKTYSSYSQFDIMCLDFFGFLMKQKPSKTVWSEMKSGEEIYNPSDFRYKAIVAQLKARKAIVFEKSGNREAARRNWKEIFGYKFPESITEESKIKKMYEKSVLLYDSQKKCIKIIKQRSIFYKTVLGIAMLLIVLGIAIIASTDMFNMGLGFFICSSLLLLVMLGYKRYDLIQITEKHKESVIDILTLRNEFKILLKDLHYSNVDISVIRKRNEELEQKIINVYKGSTKSIGKRYSKTTDLIKEISRMKEKLNMQEIEKIKFPLVHPDEILHP